MTSGISTHDGEAIASDFKAMPGPQVAVTRERPAEGGADRGAHGGDLVLGLEGRHAEVLVAGELVQDVRRRGDRVGAVEERQAALPRRGDEADGERLSCRGCSR